MRPLDEPSVIATGAELVHRITELSEKLRANTDPLAGSESAFIGQIHSGEIYNQYPQECWLEGTRRWLPHTPRREVEESWQQLLGTLQRESHTEFVSEFHFIRDAFYLDQSDPLVKAFQAAYQTLAGHTLRIGAKPFVDDGNSFWGHRQIAAITHGPQAGGQHTVNEWVSIDDLVRVAQTYALAAVAFCGGDGGHAA